VSNRSMGSDRSPPSGRSVGRKSSDEASDDNSTKRGDKYQFSLSDRLDMLEHKRRNSGSMRQVQILHPYYPLNTLI
jgi:hypothetical protein